MNPKRIFSFIFDSVYFLFTAASCLFLFFWVSDELAADTSSPIIFAISAVVAFLVPAFFLYSAVSKKLEH